MRLHTVACCLGLATVVGCASWTPPWTADDKVRSQSPEDAAKKTSDIKLVGDYAVPFGNHAIRVEGVGLVTGLAGTGSEPAPSPQRAALLAEMQARGVHGPNTVLASRNSSLVLVQAYLRPGIQKGDRIDVEVRIPSRSETESLRGGWLLETRLKEQAVLEDNQMHEGYLLGLAQGPVLVDPAAKGDKDRVRLGRGRILGGGVALKSRSLGLVLTPDNQTVGNATRLEAAINKRFYTLQRGIQIGMSKAKTEQFVELTVHPRYKDNIERYMQVVRAVAVRETQAELADRIEALSKELADAATSAHAARQFEAIGRPAIEPLKAGLKSADEEVQFYAAEALAYLDERDAVEPLARAARDEPAFRVYALSALAAMEDQAAYDALKDLLNVASAETRYGAFRALWTNHRRDPITTDDPGVKGFAYHVLSTEGPEMIHVTRSRRPEVVLFGSQQRFTLPIGVNAGTQILVTSHGDAEIAVSKFAVGEADQKRIVGTRVDEVVRAIVELGGTYPDVVQALEEAKAAGALSGRFEVDALPEGGRAYDRVASAEGEAPADEKPATPRARNPMPSLYSTGDGPKGGGHSDEKEAKTTDAEDVKKGNWFTSMFSKD